MNKLRKTGLIISAIVMTLFLCVMIKSEAFAEEVTDVTYIDENGVPQTMPSCTLLDISCFSYIDEESTLANPGTYFINGRSINDLDISHIKSIKMQGDVKFIVADSITLSLKRILFTADNSSLTIYAQSTGESRGKINVYSTGYDRNCFAIGGDSGSCGHKLIINGCDVTLDANPTSGDDYNYGIDLGINFGEKQDSALTVNGGTLKVYSKKSYAIFADYVTLNGGEVYANRDPSGSTSTVTYGGIYADKQLSLNMTDPEKDLLYTDTIDSPLTKVELKPNYKWYYVTSKALVTTDSLRFISNTDPNYEWYYNQPIKPLPAGVAQHSLSLGGTIGVNFYVYLPGNKADYDGAVMKFKIEPEGRTKEIPVSDVNAPDSDGFYCFTFNVKALEMADFIQASLVKNDEVLSEEIYSVEDYYQSISSSTGYHYVDAKILDLANALDGYGYYVQHYLQQNAKTPWEFGVKHNEMGEGGRKYYTIDEVPATMKDEARAYLTNSNRAPVVLQNEAKSINSLNFSLVMDEDTAIKLYVSVKDPETQSIASARYCVAGGSFTDVTPQKVSEGQYTILIGNIVAQDLDKNYLVTIEDGNGDKTQIQLSPFSYAYIVMNNQTDEAFENAMIMMYNYNRKANAYLNSLN